MEWTQLHPNTHGDWLNQRNDLFSAFIALGDKDKSKNTIFSVYSGGLLTSRDSWCYNFCQEKLQHNIEETISYYTEMVDSGEDKPQLDSKKISWSANLQTSFYKKQKISFNIEKCKFSLYRPFNKQFVYFSRNLNERVYQIPKIFPTQHSKNIVICLPGIGGIGINHYRLLQI